MKEEKIYKLNQYLQKNPEFTSKTISKIIEKEIKKLELKEIENNIINIKINNKIILLAICKKEEANEFAYKIWIYYYLRYINKEEVTAFSKINMNAFNLKKNHDILEITDENNKIKVKLHYVQIPELQKVELISENELLVLLEN